jgi:hypothetical protein
MRQPATSHSSTPGRLLDKRMIQPAPQAPVALLTRHARFRPSLLRRLPWTAIAAVIAIKLLVPPARELDCRTAAAQASADDTIAACERAYLRTADPDTGARLAEAQRRVGHRAVAGAIANGLLVTSARADALRVLGTIAASEGRIEAARIALENARAIDRARPHNAHVDLCTISP